jgi:hypothetical protein
VANKQKKVLIFPRCKMLTKSSSLKSWVFDVQIVRPRFPKSTKERKK